MQSHFFVHDYITPENLFPKYSEFIYAGNKPAGARPPEVFIQVDEVNLNQDFFLASSWFTSLPVMTTCRVPSFGARLGGIAETFNREEQVPGSQSLPREMTITRLLGPCGIH